MDLHCAPGSWSDQTASSLRLGRTVRSLPAFGRWTRRILIIDDDSDTTALVAMLVAAIHPSASVRTAADGEAGVELACMWSPDVVVTDIDMPLLSGIEAALEMRTLLAERPPLILAVTGNATWLSDPMALAVFDRITLKPLDEETIRTLT